MKKPLAIAVVITLTFALGAGSAMAVVTWPSRAKTFAAVNSHLNALHETDQAQFSKIKVVTEVAEPSGGNAQSANVACPDGWVATGGGFTNEDAEWYAYHSSPTFPMGPEEVTPDGWAADFSNPTYVEGTPFPTITIYAICAT